MQMIFYIDGFSTKTTKNYIYNFFTHRSGFSEGNSLSESILGTSGFDDDTGSYEDESSLSHTETSFQPDSVRIKLVDLKLITNQWFS